MIRTAAQSGLQLKERSTLPGAFSALFMLAKPGIAAAVTLSGFAGMVVAGRALPEARTAGCGLASLLLMAVGSALFNSVLDRRMDRRMKRLARRNAALERLGSGPALACAAALTCAALAIASAGLNAQVVLLHRAAQERRKLEPRRRDGRRSTKSRSPNAGARDVGVRAFDLDDVQRQRATVAEQRGSARLRRVRAELHEPGCLSN